MADVKHVNLRIHGSVQGVGFRYSAKEEADKLGVTGFVRNEPNGTVYIEAEAEEAALRKFTAWCRKGPWGAKVEKVAEEWAETKGFNGFAIGFDA